MKERGREREPERELFGMKSRREQKERNENWLWHGSFPACVYECVWVCVSALIGPAETRSPGATDGTGRADRTRASMPTWRVLQSLKCFFNNHNNNYIFYLYRAVLLSKVKMGGKKKQQHTGATRKRGHAKVRRTVMSESDLFVKLYFFSGKKGIFGPALHASVS